jgi:hypothetical protein
LYAASKLAAALLVVVDAELVGAERELGDDLHLLVAGLVAHRHRVLGRRLGVLGDRVDHGERQPGRAQPRGAQLLAGLEVLGQRREQLLGLVEVPSMKCPRPSAIAGGSGSCATAGAAGGLRVAGFGARVRALGRSGGSQASCRRRPGRSR